MQYWHRRLQRSVTEMRRLRNGRPKRSRSGMDRISMTSFAILPATSAAKGVTVSGTARYLRLIAVIVALAGASALAQGRGDQAQPSTPQAPPAPPPDEPRVAKLKSEAIADIDSMKVFTQQMVDSVFSFGELGFQEFETNRYLIDILKKNGFTVEEGIAGIPTAFMATWGSGKPILALGSDIDGI